MIRDPRNKLGVGGRELWDDIASEHELNGIQLFYLEMACDAVDRLDELHEQMTSSDTFRYDTPAGARLLRLTASTSRLLISTLAALRLPDENGRRPQRRGGPRGPYRPRQV